MKVEQFVEQQFAGKTEGPFCPPRAPHDQTWERTRAAAVGSRLTSWCMTRPSYDVLITQFQIMTLLMWERILCPNKTSHSHTVVAKNFKNTKKNNRTLLVRNSALIKLVFSLTDCFILFPSITIHSLCPLFLPAFTKRDVFFKRMYEKIHGQISRKLCVSHAKFYVQISNRCIRINLQA
jgi:hypothetical protein